MGVTDPSGQSVAIYTIVKDPNTGKYYPFLGTHMYMLKTTVPDPHRPGGHMYVEFLIDISKPYNFTPIIIPPDETFLVPAGAKGHQIWWRALNQQGIRYRTFMEDSQMAPDGNDIVFEQYTNGQAPSGDQDT